jgi:hypothetical protein
MRGVRDARAFLVPLLSTGLERAFTLSEALETRGYGSGHGGDPTTALQSVRTPIALVLLVAALPLLATGYLPFAFGLLGAALLLLVSAGTRPHVARRQVAWNRPSIVIALAATVSLAIAGARLLTSDALEYSPFPILEWPRFDAAVGLAILLLMTPAFLYE